MRNTIKAILLLLPLLLLFSQCNKVELPSDTEGDPMFEVELKTGNTVLNKFTAGLDNYYLFTSYEKAPDDVWTFIGEFRKEDSSANNSPSLRFEIRDVAANPVTVDIEQALSQSNYGFYKANLPVITDTTYSAYFSALTTDCPTNLSSDVFTWNFGDNSVEETGHTIRHVYENNSSRNVKLVVVYDTIGSQTAIQHPIFFDASVPTCSVQVTEETVQNILQQLTATGMGGNPPYNYLWQNGAITNSITIDTSDTNYYVTLTDANGCVAIASGITTDISSFCTAQFSYTTSTEIDTVPMLPQFSSVTIIYVNENGETFRTDLGAQQNTSFFTIETIENFQHNERGEKTKKLNINFQCELYSIDNISTSISVENTNGVIGIAYPD